MKIKLYYKKYIKEKEKVKRLTDTLNFEINMRRSAEDIAHEYNKTIEKLQREFTEKTNTITKLYKDVNTLQKLLRWNK